MDAVKKNFSADDIRGMVTRLWKATGAEYYFDAPVVGAADAHDGLFERFKTVIGDFHWTPEEALSRAFPGAKAASVIVWILPVNSRIRESNRRCDKVPSEEWAAMRSFGEETNVHMRRQMCRLLETYGYKTVSPHLMQTEEKFDPFSRADIASRWSERHVAFTAGLGTFGLSGGLITERGVAMRIGSVVTELYVEPSVRPYGDDPFAWCTKCGVCSRRCPGQSVGMTWQERDKHKCLDYIVANVMPHREETYGWMDMSLGCGLCQTGVPCEFKRP